MERNPHILLSLAPSNPPSYARAVKNAGGLPVGGYLPETALLRRCDGLVLGGGGDVDPAWYGQENVACDTLDGERDSLEGQLVALAVEKQIPVLGICRGMQYLNVYFGGDLIQDMGSSHSMIQGQYRLHPTYIRPDTQLHALYGAAPVVNSGHHQAVGRLASGWQAIQWALDGVVEAIACQHLPMVGVQWHPEQLYPAGERLFDWFVRQCNGHWL